MSEPIRVVTVFGTRPEAIKMAPVVAELERRPEFTCSVCISGQHREMLDDVLELFSISPDYDMDVMEEDQSPAFVVSKVLGELGPILGVAEPHWVLVQGDTTTTMAAALAAFYAKVLVGHVEAGLRTGRKWQPYPEEINRRVTDLVTDLHFAPTEQAKLNLLHEGVDPEDIVVTGNTVIDSLLEVSSRPFDTAGTPLQDLNLDGKKTILVTAHRRESFGAALQSICRAVAEIARIYPDEVQIVYPVHPNPNVTKAAAQELSDLPNVALLPPLDYLSHAQLMKRSWIILTDSGGIQEEAPSLGVPVLVLREVTERPEVVEAGAAKVVGTNAAAIVSEARRLIEDTAARAKMSGVTNPYGDGHASVRIAESLLNRPVLPK